MKAGVNSKRG